ncbi:MAG: hypothetical protein RMK84_05625 [Oscillochloridaceae bacterium]|nr:hypothetical protein [Chloroflexaceae bacterium]MDW8389583.1 hypothetical protein [Oscillochloridaceae bacterium]
MSDLARNEPIYTLRMRPKDIGVALAALLFLLGGWLLMTSVITRTRAFQDEATPLRFEYPADWIAVESLQDVVLRVVDPATPSAVKTSMTVESRPLDPANPPTLQTLLDRRVEQRQALTGYHFLNEAETEVGGARAIVTEFAYVVQPIDEPRRASLPVVVRAREYIIVTADQSYYVTFSAPDQVFDRQSWRFERVIASMVVQ